MKKLTVLLLVFALMAMLLPAGAALAEEAAAPETFESQEAPETKEEIAAPEETPDPEELSAPEEAEPVRADWTVLLYLCGTDLESDGALASANLEAIASTQPDKRVNFVFQTGGTREWQSEEAVGIEIANDRLQRWTYGENGFTLVEELANASMAKHTTLSSFVAWGAESFPAEKYMLILWDHGGGSSAGLIQDELHDGAIMSVEGLERALKNGGVHFDLIMTDTCLMASLETCQALAPYADYLVASEESLPGTGSNYAEWLQSLYEEPDCSPVRLGKIICNATQLMYAESGNSSGMNSLTFSVIDLERIKDVADAFNAYMKEVVGLLRDPMAFGEYMIAVSACDRYVFREMWDLYDMARRGKTAGITKRTAIELERAVDEAVVYNIRGSYHPYSHGLSAYMPLDSNLYYLERFARTCKNPWQLAFLDAVNQRWDSPEWIEEVVGEVPQIDAAQYRVSFDTEASEDGTQALLHIYSGLESGLDIQYDLQRYSEEEGCWYDLGLSDEVEALHFSDDDNVIAANFDGVWLSLAGELLSLQSREETESVRLLQAPIVIENSMAKLRIEAERKQTELEDESGNIVTERETEYTVLGIWDGFDSSTGLIDRNTVPLSALYGENISVCRPIYSDYLQDTGDMRYSDEFAVTAGLAAEEMVLPAGIYRICFRITDTFDKGYQSNFVELYWDGENALFGEKAIAAANEVASEAAETSEGPTLLAALPEKLAEGDSEGRLFFVNDGDGAAVSDEPTVYLQYIYYLPASEAADADGELSDSRKSIAAAGVILATDGTLREALKATGLEPETARKFCSENGFDYYILTIQDENTDDFGLIYKRELRELREALPELLKNAAAETLASSTGEGGEGLTDSAA